MKLIGEQKTTCIHHLLTEKIALQIMYRIRKNALLRIHRASYFLCKDAAACIIQLRSGLKF